MHAPQHWHLVILAYFTARVAAKSPDVSAEQETHSCVYRRSNDESNYDTTVLTLELAALSSQERILVFVRRYYGCY